MLFDKRSKHLHDIRRLCSQGVVRINEGTGDGSIDVDNEGRGKRQVELPFSVMFFNIDPKALIDGAQPFRQRKDEPEFSCVVELASVRTSNSSSFFSDVDRDASSSSGVMATKVAPAALISGRTAW